MTSQPRPRSVWYDVGWPVLAGLTAAAGLVAAYVDLGLLATVVAFMLIELTVAPTAWSIMTEMGRPGRPAVLELAPACALATVATLGLVNATRLWSLPVLLLVLLTSPILRGRDWSLGVAEHDETRRAFDEIVAHGFADDPADDDRPGTR